MTDSTLQILSALFAFGAAAFWATSALIKIPDMLKTKISGKGSITDIMSTQARYSAIGAACAAVSAIFQAISLISN
jgi:hypothetical protein